MNKPVRTFFAVIGFSGLDLDLDLDLDLESGASSPEESASRAGFVALFFAVVCFERGFFYENSS